jgi:hypothetical protein
MMDYGKIGCGDVDWTELAYCAVQWQVSVFQQHSDTTELVSERFETFILIGGLPVACYSHQIMN